MKSKNILLVLFTTLFLKAGSQNQLLKMEDIWSNPRFVAHREGGLKSMKDGIHYTDVAADEMNKTVDILIYEYKSGKVTDTLVRGLNLIPKGSAKPLAFSDYNLNDNENKIIFSADVESIYRHSIRANYFVYDRKAKTLNAVSEKGKQLYATLSHDGNKAAFVRDNNLFIKDLARDVELQVTYDGRKNEIINGANDWVYEEEFSFSRSYEWSPDGRRIAFYKFDESRVKEFSLTYYDSLYPREEKYKYPKAGEENSIVSIFIYDVITEKTLKAETGVDNEQYLPRIKWTNDPSKLCITRMNRPQNKIDLLLCDATNGSTKVMMTEENKTWIEITDDLTFLNDNTHFIWTSGRDGFNHIYLFRMDGTLEKQITKGNWDVTRYYGYDEKSKTYYYQSAEVSPMERQVYSITYDGKKKLLSAEHGMNDAGFSESFHYFINTHSDANSPYLVAFYSSDGKQLRVIEDNKNVKDAMAKFALSPKTFFKFTTSENIELNGWMIKPPDYDENKKYPVLMIVYGGPGSQAFPTQTVLDEWGAYDYFWEQMLAQKGYIIVSVDNRGTAARGEEFNKYIYKQMGKLEAMDQVETAKYLGTLSYVDKSRIGIWGWSYGGYMACLLMTKGADYFKAGIAVAPVTNWRFYDTIFSERYLLTPQENPTGYDDNSPNNFAKLLKGKFLLIQGMADDNVHFQNAAEFENALIKEKKQFETFFYPNKAHSMSGVRFHLYTKMTDFILNNL
ncbi:MAG: S9 family peptidase [Bacteroidia bacterium]